MAKEKQPKDPAEQGKEIKTAADLIQDEHNYRKHSDTNKARIRKSIDEAGLGRSVVIDADGVLVVGNGVQQVVDKDTPVRMVETDGTELVVVKRTDLHTGDPRRKTLALADNATADDVEWDFEAIEADGWNEESAGGWGVEWPADEEESEQQKAKEDDFDPDKPVETVCKKGDIWKLGNHRLMCGDSTDAASVALLMDGKQADCVLTDPPFGNDLGYGRGQLGERYIANDSDTKVLSSFFAPLDSVLKNNTHCLVWIQWRTFSVLEKAFEKYKLRTVVIWDKMQTGLSGGCFAEQYEMMCVFIKGHATQNEYCGNVWQMSREHDKRSKSEHPHKKPIALLGKALNLCSKDGDIILDLFGGSGSTMIACEQLNRKCYMMELDPHYCDVIIARWEKLTGNKAEKLK